MNKAISSARRIYLDANIVIYFFEGAEETRIPARRLFTYANDYDIRLVTSEVTIGECLFGVYKKQRLELGPKYSALFDDADAIELIPVERETFAQAAEIGAPNNLKFVDAIHVATALAEGCNVFVTNDQGIKSTPDLTVVYLTEI
jgi:predicted nucleic acid-binding protein